MKQDPRKTVIGQEPPAVAESLTKLEEKYLLEFLEPRKRDRILDIGTGSGRLASRVGALGVTIAGVDLSLAALKRATDQIPREVFDAVLCDLDTDIPFESEAFDSAFCVRVLKYLSSPLMLLAEASRVLRAGGILVLEISNWYSWEHVYYELLRRSPWKFFRKGEISEMLRLTGFKLVESRSLHKVPSPLHALDSAVRRLTPEQFLSRGIILKAAKKR